MSDYSLTYHPEDKARVVSASHWLWKKEQPTASTIPRSRVTDSSAITPSITGDHCPIAVKDAAVRYSVLSDPWHFRVRKSGFLARFGGNVQSISPSGPLGRGPLDLASRRPPRGKSPLWLSSRLIRPSSPQQTSIKIPTSFTSPSHPTIMAAEIVAPLDIDDKGSQQGIERSLKGIDTPVELENGIPLDVKAMYRKIDVRVVPWLTFLYLLAFVSTFAIYVPWTRSDWPISTSLHSLIARTSAMPTFSGCKRISS